MPDEQVQAPIETTRKRPPTDDLAWRLLFDRLDAQDDNIERIGVNTVVLDRKFDKLKAHVNDEAEGYKKLLMAKVDKDALLPSLFQQVREQRTVQLAILGILIALSPVVADHWHLLFERFGGVF